MQTTRASRWSSICTRSRGAATLAAWILANPGRFSYPQPPDYLGLTFLKQVLYGALPDPASARHSDCWNLKKAPPLPHAVAPVSGSSCLEVL